MEKTFETEVLTRLAVIESKLDNYQKIEEKAEVAYTTSQQNKQDIAKLQDNNKWLFRTTVGACIASVVELLFIIFKSGIGVG
nr:MAG TPA: hemolysin [Caudoviricetes sp.]